MQTVSPLNTFNIYKINQLLFLEAGFVHLNTILSGVFIPMFGISFFFVSIATYFVYCFMGSIMAQYENKFEDIHDVISSDKFPSAGRNIIVCLSLIVLTIPVLLLYSQNLLDYPFNSTVCTLLSILLGGLAYVFTNQNSKKFVTILFYSIASIPLVFISLVAGGVLTLPLLFIFLDIRALNEV
jgi:hypothetical protein